MKLKYLLKHRPCWDACADIYEYTAKKMKCYVKDYATDNKSFMAEHPEMDEVIRLIRVWDEQVQGYDDDKPFVWDYEWFAEVAKVVPMMWD